MPRTDNLHELPPNPSTPAGNNALLLYISLILASAYFSLLYFWGGLFGVPSLDGSLGVVLGLFICSHPAGNAIDLIYLERGLLQRLTSKWIGVRWIGLNLLTMVVGWLVIVLGAIQLSSKS